MRAVICERVSTTSQSPKNQLHELRSYISARGSQLVDEHIGHGVSGAKESRPGLDKLMKDAQRRKFDVVVAWRLDRLGRSLSHPVRLLDELESLGVRVVSLANRSAPRLRPKN